MSVGATIEQESNDRPDIKLPGMQLQVLQDAVTFGETSNMTNTKTCGWSVG